MTIKTTNEGTVLCSYFSLEFKIPTTEIRLKERPGHVCYVMMTVEGEKDGCCLSTMLVQLITAEGSVLCGAGVLFFFSLFKGQEEDFPSDHLAEKEREWVREREKQRDHAASSNLNHKADLSLKLGGDSPRGLQKASQP